MTQPGPIALALEPGTHALCTCGLSTNGAFCNGSHRRTEKGPYILEVADARTVHLCGCGTSGTGIFCDGSHARLPG